MHGIGIGRSAGGGSQLPTVLDSLIASEDPLAWYRSGEGLEDGGVAVADNPDFGGWGNGTDSVVDMGDASALNLQDFTIELTVTTGTLGTTRTLFGLQAQGALAGGKCGTVCYFHTDNKIHIITFVGTDIGSIFPSNLAYTDPTEELNLRYVKVGTSAKLYVNDVLAFDRTLSSATVDYTTSTSKKTSVGSYWNNTGFVVPTTGLIRDFKVRNASGVIVGSGLGTGPNDSDWVDTVGGNNGTVAGSPKRAVKLADGVWTPSIDYFRDRGIGGATGAWFDGTDDYVDIGDEAAFELDDFDITIVATPGTLGTFRTLFAWQYQAAGATGRSGCQIRWTDANKAQFIWTVSDTSNQATWDTACATAGKLYTIRLVKSGGDVNFYLNGVLDRTPIVSAPLALDWDSPIKQTLIGGMNSGGVVPSSPHSGMVKSVLVKDGNGAIVGSWLGTGVEDSDWEDQEGSNHGTVAGSPFRALETLTGYRRANDIPATVDFAAGVDPKGRPCPSGTAGGGEWGEVDFDGSPIAQPYAVAFVFKNISSDAVNHFLFDGEDVGSRCAFFENTSDNYNWYAGLAKDSLVPADPNWHSGIMVVDGASSKLYIDGVEVAGEDIGANSFGGVALFSTFDGLSNWEGDIADLIVIDNPSAEAVANLQNYTRVRYGI